MQFVPFQERGTGSHHGMAHDRCVDLLQCDSCAKWRRVDSATLNQYSNEQWLQDRFKRDQDDLLHAHPQLDLEMSQWPLR